MACKKRTAIEMARDEDSRDYIMSRYGSSSSSSSGISSSSSSSSSSRIAGSQQSQTVSDADIQDYLRANNYKLVLAGAVLEPALSMAALKPKANILPLYESNPNLKLTAADLAINSSAWDSLRMKPRYAGLVASSTPPEYYVYCGDVKISLLRHVKGLVALVYSLQSHQMEKSNVHFEVLYHMSQHSNKFSNFCCCLCFYFIFCILFSNWSAYRWRISMRTRVPAIFCYPLV